MLDAFRHLLYAQNYASRDASIIGWCLGVGVWTPFALQSLNFIADQTPYLAPYPCNGGSPKLARKMFQQLSVLLWTTAWRG